MWAAVIGGTLGMIVGMLIGAARSMPAALIGAAFGAIVGYVVLYAAFWIHRDRRVRAVICPRTGAREVITTEPDPVSRRSRVVDCSRWPAAGRCDGPCLDAIEPPASR